MAFLLLVILFKKKDAPPFLAVERLCSFGFILEHIVLLYYYLLMGEYVK